MALTLGYERFVRESTDANGNTVLAGVDGAQYPLDTGKAVTVGLDGDYATLQEAFDAIVQLTHFNATAFAGTVTATQGSKTVTGVGTNFPSSGSSTTLFPRYIAFDGSGKFYPIKHIVSATEIQLVSPFAEATVSGVVATKGDPIMHTIEIISDITGDQQSSAALTSDGLGPNISTDNWVDVCMTIICRPGVNVGNTIAYNVRSGILVFDGFNNKDQEQHTLFYAAPDYPTAEARYFRTTDIIYRNLHIEARNHQDVLYHQHSPGRVYLIDSYLSGHWDVYMPNASGEAYCINSTVKSLSRGGSTTEVSQAITKLLTRTGAFFYAKNSTFWVMCASNTATNRNAWCVDLYAMVPPFTPVTGCTFIFDDCDFVGEKPPGGVETNTTFAVFNVSVSDCDVYIDGKCRYIGAPTAQASWKNLRASYSTAANRFHFSPGTKMFPGLSSDTTYNTIKTDLALPSAITPGASPYTYSNNVSCFTEDIVVAGGTVSAIEITRDGTTFYNVGSTAGMFTLNQGDKLKVTYSAAPTMTKITR